MAEVWPSRDTIATPKTTMVVSSELLITCSVSLRRKGSRSRRGCEKRMAEVEDVLCLGWRYQHLPRRGVNPSVSIGRSEGSYDRAKLCVQGRNRSVEQIVKHHAVFAPRWRFSIILQRSDVDLSHDCGSRRAIQRIPRSRKGRSGFRTRTSLSWRALPAR